MVYDCIIIGAGPAGYFAAERASSSGLNVLLIEKRSIGGVCVNEGCIPTKTLLYSAKIYDTARFGEKYGITASALRIDHNRVMERKNKVVKTLSTAIQNRLKSNHVKIFKGAGKITGKNSAGFTVEANNETFTGKNLLIATGSLPIIPAIDGGEEGLKTGYVVTNREILEWKTIPASLVVIGAGAIGLEFASYFNSLGSKVTIIEILPTIAGNTDRQIAEILKNNFEKGGIEFKLCSRVIALGKGVVTYSRNGEQAVVQAEKVLLSVGRRPVSEELGLETIGVEIEKGKIKVDDKCMTNVSGVYAAGDVNGISMLAHTAYREADVCVNSILGKNTRMSYAAIPSVIYTNPEVACVGETEDSATEKGIEFDVAVLSMRYSGRYLAENEGGDGICKVLIDKKTKRLIGVHIIGNAASEIIYGASLMIEKEMRIEDIREFVFPHPTVSEIIREAVFQL